MISQRQKPLLVTCLLAIAIALAYSAPHQKYQSNGTLKTITLPDKIGNWKGENVKQDINLGQDKYAFIGDIKTKKYVNSQGFIIYFTLLDADNFHNPRVCFNGAGYTPMDLENTVLETSNTKFQAPTVFFKKPGEDILLIYWLCINKQRVDWAGQKMKEFLFSISGTKKAGFTVRMDIPVDQQNIPLALTYAQDLVKTLSHNLPKNEAEYIFGK